MVFEEFKEIIHQIWKTIFDNFETFDFTKLFESSENVSDSFSSKMKKKTFIIFRQSLGFILILIINRNWKK
ncbi:hypothetical protein D3C87_486330 [compost metagenome]